jgi:hypothetical protein
VLRAPAASIACSAALSAALIESNAQARATKECCVRYIYGTILAGSAAGYAAPRLRLASFTFTARLLVSYRTLAPQISCALWQNGLLEHCERGAAALNPPHQSWSC